MLLGAGHDPYVEATMTLLLETSPEISAKVLKAESAKK